MTPPPKDTFRYEVTFLDASDRQIAKAAVPATDSNEAKKAAYAYLKPEYPAISPQDCVSLHTPGTLVPTEIAELPVDPKSRQP